MKKFLSPAFFVLAIICFFLPFVSVSCNPAAVQEGLEGLGDSPVPGPTDAPFPGGGFPGGGGEVELFSVTGFDIVIGSDIDVSGPLGGLGGAQPTEDAGSAGDFEGRFYVILALAAAVLGLGLSFLREKLGSAMATVMGVAGLAFLLLFRMAFSPDLGAQADAAAGALSVNWKIGWWLALVAFVLAAAAGVWVAMTGTGAPATVGYGETAPPGEPPPQAPPDQPPPQTPPDQPPTA